MREVETKPIWEEDSTHPTNTTRALMKIKIWKLMAVILVLALPLTLLRLASVFLTQEYLEIERIEARSRAFPPGHAIKLVEDYAARVLLGNGPTRLEDFYHLNNQQTGGANIEHHLKSGTLALVTMDSGDNDDTVERLVAIKIVGGPHDGSVVVVPRRTICER